MFKHLLVAIDGSQHALNAAERAVELARRFDATLTLIHVARRFHIPESVKAYLRDEHLHGEPLYDIDAATRKVIDDVRREAEDAGLQSIQTVFKEGRPARTIADYAASHQVDAIVLGSRGLADPEAFLLGSVSHKVANLATCTVIIVR